MNTSLPLLPQFKKFISVCKKGKRTKYIGKKLTKGTISQYECVYNLLEEFEKKENILVTILLLNKPTIAVIRKEKKYWDTKGKQYCYDYYYPGGSVMVLRKKNICE